MVLPVWISGSDDYFFVKIAIYFDTFKEKAG